jgi:hypothetical protein
MGTGTADASSGCMGVASVGAFTSGAHADTNASGKNQRDSFRQRVIRNLGSISSGDGLIQAPNDVRRRARPDHVFA